MINISNRSWKYLRNLTRKESFANVILTRQIDVKRPRGKQYKNYQPSRSGVLEQDLVETLKIQSLLI